MIGIYFDDFFSNIISNTFCTKIVLGFVMSRQETHVGLEILDERDYASIVHTSILYVVHVTQSCNAWITCYM